MNEISEEQVREAARRLLEHFEVLYWGEHWFRPSKDDIRSVCQFVEGKLSRRDAEQAEREKPIDAEWLELISSRCPFSERWRVLLHRVYGESEYKTQLRARICDNGKCLVMIEQDGEPDCDGIEAEEDVVSFGHDITTRGQLLDLLAALKGGAS